ncbi:acetate--CoA ligase family protein, partial [Frankia casuarinae]
AAPLLLGYLGSTPVDIAALEDLLLKIARLADDVPEVVHLTLDPVIVSTGRVTVLSVEIVAGPSAPRADVGPRRFWTPNHPTPDGATIRGGSAQHAHAVHNRLP